MKHTPAPWGIGEAPDVDTGGIHICNPNTGGGICGLWSGFSISDEEQSANAKLIVAAPDLLDACQALYDNFLSRGGNPDSLLGIQVREALKKAND